MDTKASEEGGRIDGGCGRDRAVSFHSQYRHRRSQARQKSRTGAHSISAGAERLSSHRPRKIDLPQFWIGGRVRRPSAIFVLTIPTRARKTSSTSIRSKKTFAGSGSIGAIGNFTRRTISSSSISSRFN